MEMFTSKAFDRLAEFDHQWCVTILLPTARTGRESAEGPIRLKNLLKEAQSQLEFRGVSGGDARNFLKPLVDLQQDDVFWTHQKEGLALFLSPDGAEAYATPVGLEERVTVDRNMDVTPLVAVAFEDIRFFVLALSAKQVRLFECTRQSEHEVQLPDGPDSLEELLEYEGIESEPHLQFHTRAEPTVGTSSRAAVFHGQPGGEADAEQKQRLREFCRSLDKRVTKALAEDEAPLVVACEERLAAIYRDVNTYKQLVGSELRGNPEAQRAEQLRAAAWRLVSEQVDACRQRAVARLEEARGHDQSLEGLAEVVPAANEGRIDTLFVTPCARHWGTIDPTQRSIEVHERPEPSDRDLVNAAVLATRRQGGAVFRMSEEDALMQGCLTGIPRY